MRVEATTEEWKLLYEAATRINELKPWDTLWDMDIIGIQTGDNPENTAFYSVLGKGGDCYGITVYEGYDEFNGFMMLTMREELNLSVEYAMFNQQNLTCYWGDREELSAKQRQIIKELGYKYRGKNNWLYFLSYEPGYFPYNLNQDQVLTMTRHLEKFKIAFTQYKKTAAQVDFQDGMMYACVCSENGDSWDFSEEPLPFMSYNLKHLMITDEELLADLAQMSKGDTVLEADIRPLAAPVADKKYDKPANPVLCILADKNSGMVISCEMAEPTDDPMIKLADTIIGFIYEYGMPKEIRVTNVIVEAALEQISDICNIKLRHVKKLAEIDDFFMAFKSFE